MAKEETIRKRAIEELREDGWVVHVPTRRRYGSGTTYLKGKYEQSDDIFTIWDLIAWKEGELFLLQYTSKEHVSTRVNKIKDFMEKNDLEFPCRAEVWGYENRVGFVRKIELIS